MFNFCIRNRPLAPILCLGFMSCDESDGENREDNATTIPSSLIAQHNISLITEAHSVVTHLTLEFRVLGLSGLLDL